MMKVVDECKIEDDRKLYPVLDCNGVDLTLAFQQCILAIGISSFLVLSILIHLKGLLTQEIKVFTGKVYKVQIVLATVDVVLQILLIAFWAKNPLTKFSVWSACFGIVAALGLCILIAIEHPRTIRPSTLVTVYSGCAILAGLIQLRSLQHRFNVPNITLLLSVSTFDKFLLLTSEQWPKDRILKLDAEYSPEDLSGVFGRLFFWWLVPLLQKGYRTTIEPEDMPSLRHEIKTEKMRREIIDSWEKYKIKKSYPLIRAVVSLLSWPYLGALPPEIIGMMAKYSQTFVMSAAIRYLETPSHLRSQDAVYGLIVATALSYFISLLCSVVATQRVNRAKVMLQGSLRSLIYHTALSSQTSDEDLAALTLMSNDVESINGTFDILWGGPVYILEAAIGIWLLWRQIGVIALAPFMLLLLCTFIQRWVGSRVSESRRVWNEAIQKRVGLTSSLLRSMKGVKMSGLVKTSEKMVLDQRIRELNLGVRCRWFITWMNSFANIPILSPLVVFAGYAIQAKLTGGPPLSTSQAFASLALIYIVKGPSTLLLISLSLIYSTGSAFQRIEDFLKRPSFEDHRPNLESGRSLQKEAEKAIELKEVVLDLKAATEPVSINFDVPGRSIVMISGPVGCGKSILLKAILGEVHPKSGRISISTTYVGYCSQSPWLQNATIKKNIIGSNDYDDLWYQKILDICNLKPDIGQMPKGDDSLLGSRGISVSGGQKQRIALARALYSRCSLLVLDDIFSSLDRKTQSIIANKLFSSGGHAETHKMTVVFTTHSAGLANFSSRMLVFNKAGSPIFAGLTKDWLKEKDSREEWKLPDEEPASETKKDTEDADAKEVDSPRSEQKHDEQLRRNMGDASLWGYYFKTFGIFNLILIVVLEVTMTTGEHFPEIWLKFTTGDSPPSIGAFIGVFSFASILAWNCNWAQIAQITINVVRKSAIKLHEVLVKTTFNAPMSFFESTDTSLLINRFSQDMSQIEMALPIYTWQFFGATVATIADAALISVGSYYMFGVMPFVIIILFWIQRFYLRTSRQMRILELEVQAPIYRHFTETLEGLATIRAFGWKDAFDKEVEGYIEESQKVVYTFNSVQIWLSLALQLLSCVLAVVLVALALCIPSSSDPGLIGIGMTTSMMLAASIQRMVKSGVGAETALGVIARTKSFEENTPNENAEQKLEPQMDWPHGNMKVSNLIVTYDSGTLALKGIDIDAVEGQKIGICGRTGSGKSTFISILLRLIDPTSGDVKIDDIDMDKLSRNSVRERLVCLPQDPLLLPGTYKVNLDPEAKIKDQKQIEKALQQVQLWEVIEGKGGLDTELQLDSLSYGEQQLLSLARAILKKQAMHGHCILILDEATSNLDSKTEGIVQEVLDKEFQNCTVIAVAHKLHTLRNYDKIVVLDQGKVSKVGPATGIIAELKS